MYSFEDNLETAPLPENDLSVEEEISEAEALESEIEEFESSSADTDSVSEQASQKTTTVKIKKFSFHILSSVLTFVLLPHFWCFSIPAIIFARESKRFFTAGNIPLSRYFANKAKRFIVSSWLITLVVALILFAFSFAIGLSTL